MRPHFVRNLWPREMPSVLEMVFRAAAEVVPTPVLRAVAQRTLKGHGVGVCLHRVGPRRPTDPYPHTTADASEVDAFLRVVAPVEASRGAPEVVMAFDDGYADAAAYVSTRAPSHPAVEWLMFVCPEKVQKQAGFRWDLFEVEAKEGKNPIPLGPYLREDLDVENENDRDALKDVAARPEYRLASESELRRLAELPNVGLGNHTNAHFFLTSVSHDDAQKDLERSCAQFISMFGPMEDFAFPFGQPTVHFDEAHVAFLRSIANATLWSTADGVYEKGDRKPGAVLPRVVFRGLWSGKAMAMFVVYVALRQRLRNLRKPQRLATVTPLRPNEPAETRTPAA